MLRLILVFGIILVGGFWAIRGPFYALLFYLWYAYFRPEQWVWTDYVSPLNLSFITGALVLLSSIPRMGTFRWSPPLVLTAAFFAQSIVSLLASEHFALSLPHWIEFLKIVIITMLISFLVVDRQSYRRTLLVIAFSLGFESAKQGWAQMVLNPGATNNNPHPVLGDNNGVAVGMMMLIPFFVALAQTASKRWEKYLHRFFIVGLLYRGISTYSRGGFLSAAALGLVALWRSPRKFRALIGVGVVAMVVASVLPPQFWDRMGTITSPEEEQDSSAQGRLFYWTIAARMASAKPVTGVGFAGFKASFTSYDTSGGAYGADRAVHSAWFGVVSEMGYPGLILLVAVIVATYYRCSQIARKARSNPETRDLASYAAAIQISLVAFAVGNTFLNGQYGENFWHLIGLAAALERISTATAKAPAAAKVAAPQPVGPIRLRRAL